MSIEWEGGENLAEYIKLRESGKLNVGQRPKICRSCSETNCFWAHGSYSRHLEEGELSADIKVPRWKCGPCGSTESSPPSFAVPRCRYTKRVMGAGVGGYAGRLTSYRREVVKLGEVGPSPSQLFQWVKEIAGKANGLLVEVQGMCLSAGQEAGLLRAEAAICPNGYKAVVEGKSEKLDTLAKLKSYAGVLFQASGDEFCRLGLLLLGKSGQEIFSSQVEMVSTPQRRKPRNCRLF